ncbi:g1820 [Coccomyxa elongata]
MSASLRTKCSAVSRPSNLKSAASSHLRTSGTPIGGRVQPSATFFGARPSLPNGQATGAKVVQSQPSVRCSSGGGGSGGGSSGRGGGGGGGGGDSGSGGSLWATYLRLLETQPVWTKAWSAALLNAIGDVLAQLVVDKNEKLDYKRLGIFTILGLTIIGPPLHYWYLLLSKVAVTGLPGTFLRMALDQLVWAPIFLSTIVAAQFTLEGKSGEVVPKLKQDMKEILMTNWKVWIPFQFFNFNFVPQVLQVLASNVMALAWNIYMSSMSHKEVAHV